VVGAVGAQLPHHGRRVQLPAARAARRQAPGVRAGLGVEDAHHAGRRGGAAWPGLGPCVPATMHLPSQPVPPLPPCLPSRAGARRTSWACWTRARPCCRRGRQGPSRQGGTSRKQRSSSSSAAACWPAVRRSICCAPRWPAGGRQAAQPGRARERAGSPAQGCAPRAYRACAQQRPARRSLTSVLRRPHRSSARTAP
jgi:hypothetical protein